MCTGAYSRYPARSLKFGNQALAVGEPRRDGTAAEFPTMAGASGGIRPSRGPGGGDAAPRPDVAAEPPSVPFGLHELGTVPGRGPYLDDGGDVPVREDPAESILDLPGQHRLVVEYVSRRLLATISMACSYSTQITVASRSDIPGCSKPVRVHDTFVGLLGKSRLAR